MTIDRLQTMEQRETVAESRDATLRATLDREFDDLAATRQLPSADDQRAHQAYLESKRRLVLASPRVGIGADLIDPNEIAPAPQVMGGLTSVLKRKITANDLVPMVLGSGLYDYFPPELPAKGAFHPQPFKQAFTHQKQDPATGSILLTVPQVGTGRFYSSAATLSTGSDHFAQAWSGVYLPIDPTLHAEGPKDVVVWAEGTMSYDYALTATPGAPWNQRPLAAAAKVTVFARLLRFSRQTGQPMTDVDAPLAFLAGRSIVDAKLLPNAATTSPPSSSQPSVGGPYASWSSWPTNFSLDLKDGVTRKLEPDSTYLVALLCSVSLEAYGAATAEVSAQMFVRLATLGILPHDPKVTI